ncbi:MAG TPA: carboxylate-amine ligase [Alphaproteobacteria bacterium]|nr:carboxylate-amine ligase [Alphaproteobacteria bacterium]
MKEPKFTVGIEEEYHLVDRETRDLVEARPDAMMAKLEKSLKTQVTPEFMNSQIEIGTKVCGSIADAAADLKWLRKTVSDAAADEGMAIIAASTHPFASWATQQHTDKERYNILARDMQAVARRLLISGMHVHVGIEDEELRIDLLNQISYFLPHILALSTSSPFWRGKDTGLKSYRLAVFDELPRTGLPPQFDSWGEYNRHIHVLTNAGLIEDASKLWWDIRPSARFPTLEMRIADVPTRVEDSVCLAALYRCLLRMLYRLRRENQRWRRYANMLISENRWRAQRYGFDEGMIDLGKGEIVPYADLLDELIELTREDAEFFGCVAEVEHGRVILKRGTSAHRQLALYNSLREQGVDKLEALKGVVDQLIEETTEGL